MICPSCKTSVPDRSNEVELLEAQVRQLSQRLALAVDKAADLEDDLRLYKTGSPSSANSIPTSETSSFLAQSRLTNFISARKGSLWGTRTQVKTPPPSSRTNTPQRTPTPNPRETLDPASLPLEEQLTTERNAREAAEEKVASMTLELEELTQNLFEEANAMVRNEREKCSRLEARLAVMESREDEKRRRLTELEKAVERIMRVRSVLEGNTQHAKVLSSVG